jgi:hypothetical protein
MLKQLTQKHIFSPRARDEVTFVEDGRMDFTVDVLPSSGSGAADVVERLGVSGFQPLTLWLGLAAVALALNIRPRKIH